MAAQPEEGDFEKLQKALGELSSLFDSPEKILDAFGISSMPTAHRYGILFGFIVFTLTVASVTTLLVMGGSFARIKEQAETGRATIQESYKTRRDRALLLQNLLDAQDRMLKENYPNREKPKEGKSNLTKMLLTVAPVSSDKKPPSKNKNIKNAEEKKDEKFDSREAYQDDYTFAYRKCQDKPGGGIITGRPEARYEAFARAYAGCGSYTANWYRRSYARMYETITCENHQSDDKFGKIFKERPHDIIGKFVRLEALEVDRHLEDLHAVTCGKTVHEKKSYDPLQVWGFLEEGPFKSSQELRNSFVFQQYSTEASFAIVQNLTDRLMGVVRVCNDNPKNLSIQIDPPIVAPTTIGTKEELEAAFLLIDRLFAHGYRRIQIAVDEKDENGVKIASRLGFTFEGILLKHMIVKESSRDSSVFGMLNSDWSKGARKAMFKKLYGAAAARADDAYNIKEEELEEQQRVLAENKLQKEQENKK